MIGQYLPNNNEKSYSAILQKNLDLNRPLVYKAIRDKPLLHKYILVLAVGL
jgi:hypothetical protein